MYGFFHYHIVGLKLCLFRPFSHPLTFLRAKSDFHPTKPPLSSEQTRTFLSPSAQTYFYWAHSVRKSYQSVAVVAVVAVLERGYHIPDFTSIFIYIFIYIYKYRTISRICTIIFGTATTATTATDSTNLNYNVIFIVLNKRLNEQVKRNIERFPDDFMFQLTKEEWNILRSQIATANTPENKAIAFLRSQFATTKNLSKIRTLPYAFTKMHTSPDTILGLL